METIGITDYPSWGTRINGDPQTVIARAEKALAQTPDHNAVESDFRATPGTVEIYLYAREPYSEKGWRNLVSFFLSEVARS